MEEEKKRREAAAKRSESNSQKSKANINSIGSSNSLISNKSAKPLQPAKRNTSNVRPSSSKNSAKGSAKGKKD